MEFLYRTAEMNRGNLVITNTLFSVISIDFFFNIPFFIINHFIGDVVGVYMDVNSGCVRFYLNGRDLGVVYPLNLAQFRKLAESSLHPALSFTSYQQAIINFGAEKFR